jgi:hypothetical protein
MTALLRQAFEAAAKLPPAEQDLIAVRFLAELAAEDKFDQALASSGETLTSLAAAALAEHRTGLTWPLDPDRL